MHEPCKHICVISDDHNTTGNWMLCNLRGTQINDNRNGLNHNGTKLPGSHYEYLIILINHCVFRHTSLLIQGKNRPAGSGLVVETTSMAIPISFPTSPLILYSWTWLSLFSSSLSYSAHLLSLSQPHSIPFSKRPIIMVQQKGKV